MSSFYSTDGMAQPSKSPPVKKTADVVASLRTDRWKGQEYADITKLREIAARHDQASTGYQQRAARLNAKIDKIRHQSTVLREKSQKALQSIPELEQEMAQYERDIKNAMGGHHQSGRSSDATALQYRIRKIQQKIVDRQHKSRTYELKAAQRAQKTAELEVRADHYLEKSKLEEQEAQAYRQRADRLQMVSDQEARPPSGTAWVPEGASSSRDSPSPQ